ncbi:N-acetylmuramoyl-L-alanine amidase [Leptotrichia sp. OH3620_COT-345]|uniref:N-acetylmuramoyl-L-alanine amidase family protein n=1 Tax=Leptotrichia sp. OH3620_COT-345 TaxID=2491048 RepID=UPI000F64A9F2|nr:N-acetylmuramoyl-L-alanine amidase [Leptotrichia sp. OH3620_COT-345]RRD39917.1 N-acetylmuramoyl-L-alanine amidase [Leptotrichia sp. OH3620_COT-345]
MKRVLILLLLIMSTIVFSETLEKVTYRNGVYTAIFKEKRKINTSATFNQSQSILALDFQNVTVKNNIPETLKVNDQYVDTISITEVAGIATISFYLKKGTAYRLVSRNGEIQATFSREKDGSTGTQSVKLKPTQPTKKKKYTIVVDAGHGGKDSGATANGYREKDLALAISQKLANNLRKDFNVIMTRNTDVFIPLQTRAKIANDANADFFVSIHLNAGGSSANGAETFYFSKKESAYAAEVARFENSVDSGYADIPLSDFIINDIFYRINQQKSAAVATDVLDSIVSNFGLRRRGVFGANFAVLRGTNAPAILVEVGFITNYSDIDQYLSESGKERLASGIANAIRKHFN